MSVALRTINGLENVETKFMKSPLSKNTFLQPLSKNKIWVLPLRRRPSPEVREGLSSPFLLFFLFSAVRQGGLWCMFDSEAPSPSLAVCGVESGGAASKRLKLWKRAQIWVLPFHDFARGRWDRSGGFLDLFRAEAVEVVMSMFGYRSAWRETRRVKIG